MSPTAPKTEKPAEVPAEKPAAPALSFAAETEFVSTRQSEPNPFTDPLTKLKAAEDGTPKAFSVPVPSDDPKDKTVAKYNRQLNDASKALDVTCRRGVLPDGKGGFKLTFKVTDRIKRTKGSTTASA